MRTSWSKTALTPAVQPVAVLRTARSAKSASPAAVKLSRQLLESLDDAKAEDIVSIDLRGKTTIADTMIIATGRSTTHVGAIAERVVKACKESGALSPRIEGLPQGDWVLVDAGDAIVHIFRSEVRQFYNLEKLWGGDRPAEKAARAGSAH